MALQTVSDWLNNKPGGRPEWSPNRRIHDYYDGIALAELLRQQKDKSMVHDVLFTLKAKKQLETGEFIEIERVLGRESGVVSAMPNTAIAIAARKLPETVTDEMLGAATVVIKQVS